MALPTSNLLEDMGFTYNGQPFVEIDAQANLTSPGYMGIPYNGEPVTFAPFALQIRRGTSIIRVGGMGIKRPHLP